ILGAIIAYILTTLPPSNNVHALPYLFLSGALAICAMILPGISGAFILVLLGSYKTILDALHERDFKIIITVGLGIVFGILSFSRWFECMFTDDKNATLAILTAFILGSLNKILPWKEVMETKIFNDKLIVVKDQNISPFTYEGDPQIITG